MTDKNVEHLLESTDLSNRSKIRNSLRRDLLDRNPRQMPRQSGWLNALALGIMAIGVVAIGVLVLERGPNLSQGSPSQQSEATPTLPTEIPTATPFGPSVMALTPTIVPYMHTVQEGDTLFSIVQQYGWEDPSIIATVLQMNGLTSESEITVGMTLLIPPRIETAPFEPCPAGYDP